MDRNIKKDIYIFACEICGSVSRIIPHLKYNDKAYVYGNCKNCNSKSVKFYLCGSIKNSFKITENEARMIYQITINNHDENDFIKMLKDSDIII